MIDRRTLLISTGAVAAASSASPVLGHSNSGRTFPPDFIWAAATAGHQSEGNDTASDTWFLANIEPTAFAEPVGDAVNSFELWPTDLDLCAAMGLNAYRFSVEWSRIEPERGQFSRAMLDHYKRMVEGCHQRGLRPIVTFNHFTSPRWFAEAGGWLNPQAPDLFANYCDHVARAMGDGISHAVTFNEPNLPQLLASMNLPPQVQSAQRANLERAEQLTGSERFVAANVVRSEDMDALEAGMLIGHRRAKQAIKAVRSDLPVGVSLAVVDEQAAAGGTALRDEMRARIYGAWLESAKTDDYLGVQNYERSVWGEGGRLPAPEDAVRGHMGAEVYPASLAGAVRYAHEVSGVPILVSEHGVGSSDDSVRAWLIPEALRHLHQAIEDGVPVVGYCHWSLLDNFEWVFGYGPKFGLHSVDRETFVRTPKASAVVYEAIARSNSV